MLVPSFVKANVVFNYITWFSFLYGIVAYIRLYPKSWFDSIKITGLMTGVCDTLKQLEYCCCFHG